MNAVPAFCHENTTEKRPALDCLFKARTNKSHIIGSRKCPAVY